MPILKNITVDEFENVTILILEKISMRSKKIGDRIHVVVSEADKSDSENALVINDELSFAGSDKAHNIDMIFDIPNEKSLDQFIRFLQELKEDHYPKKEVSLAAYLDSIPKSELEDLKKEYLTENEKIPKGWVDIEQHLPMVTGDDYIQHGALFKIVKVKFKDGNESESQVGDHNMWYYVAKEAGITHWWND